MKSISTHGKLDFMKKQLLRMALAAAGFFLCGAAHSVPMIGGCPVFPANNYWNTPIDQLPVHPSSTVWQDNMRTKSNGQPATLWPDWGRNTATDPRENEIIIYGIPFDTVTSAQPNVTIRFEVDDESDAGPYPIPPNARIEGGPFPENDGDRHVLITDTTNCVMYELYRGFPAGDGTWDAYSGAKFDMNSNALRPDRWTSADAAGFAVTPGLVRWEEVAAGEINHAIRITAQNIWGSTGGSGRKYLWPARHWSGLTNNPNFPPMGARFRLKASFNISGYHPQTQVILRAMKKYGLVLADGGSNWFISGMSDTNWPSTVLSEIKSIVVSPAVPMSSPVVYNHIFEVVDTSLLQIDPNSAQAVQVPDAPSNVIATPGGGQASLAFTAPANGGSPITAYRTICNPGNITVNSTASPTALSGLANGTTYSCTIAAANVTGYGAPSAIVSVTPGVPTISLSTNSLNFGGVSIYGGSRSLPLTVTNTGSGDLSISGILLTGATASYTLPGTCPAPGILPAGAQCVINATFTPAVAGAANATLTISSNAPGAATSIVNLSGTGAVEPGAPVLGSSAIGNNQVTIFFDAPALDGGLPIAGYTATCDPGAIVATGTVSPITVSGLQNGTPYSCAIRAVNAAGISAPSASVNATPSAGAILLLLGVQSRKTHAAAGTFDVPIDTTQGIGGAITVEPRAIGAGHQIVFQFTVPITSFTSLSVTDATMAPIGSFSSASVGNDLQVTLTGIPDNRRVLVNLNNANGPGGASVAAAIGFLVGDVNNSRAVNATDISGVKARSGLATNSSNFRFDLNSSGGINATDIAAVKARSGLVLP
jgi:Abnormal spindle-like microcephaly-assoc'd, ASPM-SPD-2-Hydin/Fibronectin type III domain/Dockerin type I domain